MTSPPRATVRLAATSPGAVHVAHSPPGAFIPPSRAALFPGAGPQARHPPPGRACNPTHRNPKGTTMADKATCYVTTCTDDGPAYGVRADTDESVYIPRSIADDLDLAELDTIEAVMVVSADGDKNRWRVLRARIVEAAQ